MSQPETPGESRRKRKYLEEARKGRKNIIVANLVVSILFVLVWVLVLYAI